MAALGAQSIASSYEQLLHVDADGGGNTTTHVSVKDGDNGTTFGFTIATDALMMSSTNRLEFGDTGTYIHQSADGVLDLVSDTEIELTATTIDINGAVAMDGAITGGTNITISGELDAATLDISGNADIDGTTNLDAVDIDGAVQLDGTFTVGTDGSGQDVILYSGTAGDNFTWDSSEECLTITGTDGAQALKVADGDLVVVDKLYIYDNDGGEYLSGDGTDLTITSGDKINLTATSDVHIANGTGVVIGHTAQETISIGDGATDLVPELQMLGTGQVDSSLMLAAFSTTATSAGAPLIALVKGGNATIGSHTVVTDGEELGNIIAYGDDGTDLEAPAAMIQFEVDGTPGTGDMPGRIVFATTTDGGETLAERMRINAAGDVTVSTGDIVFSTAGKGICLGVTSNTDANTLDDYEEGTWTPTFGTSGGSFGTSYSTQVGHYTKIGRQITAQCRIGVDTVSADGSGGALILGLPFTSSSTSHTHGHCAVTHTGGFGTTGGAPTNGYIAPNTTIVTLTVYDNDGGNVAGTGSSTGADIDDGTDFIATMIYRV